MDSCLPKRYMVSDFEIFSENRYGATSRKSSLIGDCDRKYKSKYYKLPKSTFGRYLVTICFGTMVGLMTIVAISILSHANGKTSSLYSPYYTYHNGNRNTFLNSFILTKHLYHRSSTLSSTQDLMINTEDARLNEVRILRDQILKDISTKNETILDGKIEKEKIVAKRYWNQISQNLTESKPISSLPISSSSSSSSSSLQEVLREVGDIYQRCDERNKFVIGKIFLTTKQVNDSNKSASLSGNLTVSARQPITISKLKTVFNLTDDLKGAVSELRIKYIYLTNETFGYFKISNKTFANCDKGNSIFPCLFRDIKNNNTIEYEIEKPKFFKEANTYILGILSTSKTPIACFQIKNIKENA